MLLIRFQRESLPPSANTVNLLLPYGSTFQNARSATDLAYLLSADVPGVKVPLSPAVLKEAACCRAVLIVFVLPVQYAASHWANIPDPPLGTVPKAEAFSSAASSCCRSCILAWSSDDRLAPVVVLE